MFSSRPELNLTTAEHVLTFHHFRITIKYVHFRNGYSVTTELTFVVLVTDPVQKSTSETVFMNQFTNHDSRSSNSGFVPHWDCNFPRVCESDQCNHQLDFGLPQETFDDIRDIDAKSFDQYLTPQVSQGDAAQRISPSLFNDWEGNSGLNHHHSYGNESQNYQKNLDYRSSSASSYYDGSPPLPLHGTVSSACSSPYYGSPPLSLEGTASSASSSPNHGSLSLPIEEASASAGSFEQYEMQCRINAHGWPRVVNENNALHMNHFTLNDEKLSLIEPSLEPSSLRWSGTSSPVQGLISSSPLLTKKGTMRIRKEKVCLKSMTAEEQRQHVRGINSMATETYRVKKKQKNQRLRQEVQQEQHLNQELQQQHSLLEKSVDELRWKMTQLYHDAPYI